VWQSIWSSVGCFVGLTHTSTKDQTEQKTLNRMIFEARREVVFESHFLKCYVPQCWMFLNSKEFIALIRETTGPIIREGRMISHSRTKLASHFPMNFLRHSQLLYHHEPNFKPIFSHLFWHTRGNKNSLWRLYNQIYIHISPYTFISQEYF